MRTVHFVHLLLLLLLGSCQSTKMTIVINELKPGMLKGRTVALEGMLVTSANWPGKAIDTPILNQAEKALQRGLKGAHVCILPEADSINASSESASTLKGGVCKNSAEDFSKSHSNQTDYIFRIMLRSDSTFHSTSLGRDATFSRPGVLSRPGWSMFGRGSSYFNSGYALSSFNDNGYSGRGYFTGSYSWREIERRTLKADYILSDSKTFKVIWRARAVSSEVQVNVNNSVFAYRSPADFASELPLEPLWISMNAVAARTIQKSGAVRSGHDKSSIFSHFSFRRLF